MRHGYLAIEPSRDAMLLCGLTNCKRMRERQWAQVTVSKQYRVHAFCKRRPRLRTAVESKSFSTQGRGLFSSRPSVQEMQRKRGLCYQGNLFAGRRSNYAFLELRHLFTSVYKNLPSCPINRRRIESKELGTMADWQGHSKPDF